jgi:hypothetical protein
MDKKVRQVRICVEVLRSHLITHQPNASQQAKLEKKEQEYRLTAYTTLLDNLSLELKQVARTLRYDPNAP